jgi:hypothetical protein
MPVSGTPTANHTENAAPPTAPTTSEAASGSEGASTVAAAQSRTEESMRVNEQLAAIQDRAATHAAFLKLQESLSQARNDFTKSIGSSIRSASQ